MKPLEQLLKKNRPYHFVLPLNVGKSKFKVFDFTDSNTALKKVDIADTEVFSRYIDNEMEQVGAHCGIGKYNENREIYKRSSHFGNAETARTIHLGVDLWMPAGTPVLAPLPAVLHSKGNNDNFGDYGATIILKHELEGTVFYTLYGHLSLKSIEKIKADTPIEAGEQFAELGEPNENGNWPPHLHFQLISDMQYNYGDYPGVANIAEQDFYTKNCPDPNLILEIPLLCD